MQTETFYSQYDFQDEGHTGKIHNIEILEDKHLGMFVFDLGGVSEFVCFELTLYIKSLDYSIVDVPLFKIIPGTFTMPENIPNNNFYDSDSLINCGWEPIMVPDGSSGSLKVLEKVVSTFGIDSDGLLFKFVFPFNGRYLGFLIKPLNTDPGSFEVEFNHSQDVIKPTLTCQLSTNYIIGNDAGDGLDEPRYCRETVLDVDQSFGKDKAKPLVDFKCNDLYSISDASQPLRIKGTDPTVNYSMVIQHISLFDKGRVIEVYGFNGYTDRYYYPDFGRFFEKASIKKLNYVTWSGLLVEKPWCSMLWYGEILYFANQDEFGKCCRLYIKDQSETKCPVCGELLGKQLSFSFIDITRIPHQINFCSRECMAGFNSNMIPYRRLLTKPNNAYVLNNGL